MSLENEFLLQDPNDVLLTLLNIDDSLYLTSDVIDTTFNSQTYIPANYVVQIGTDTATIQLELKDENDVDFNKVVVAYYSTKYTKSYATITLYGEGKQIVLNEAKINTSYKLMPPSNSTHLPSAIVDDTFSKLLTLLNS